ncbi:MAG TPA: GreA/GreB family elongation factor [Geothrix sp.]
MNRAFVKDPDETGAPEPLPERPQSPHTNYVTPAGLRQLQSLQVELETRRQRLLGEGKQASPQDLALVQRDLRYVEERVGRAVLVSPGAGSPDRVHFGATVEVRDEVGASETFTIVGEDEADPALGKLSWVSPLATALLNAEPGELVKWRRPAGPQELEIVAIRPGEPRT